MKNRKTILVAFMLVAVMLIGVGYAALTDTFTITGSAEVKTDLSQNEFDEKIYFFSATAPRTEDGNTTGTSGVVDTASVNANDDDKASFSVKSLALKDEYAVFTFVIKNDSEFAATIAIKTNPTNNTGYFDTVVEFPDGNTISAHGTLTVTITTKLIKNVTEPVTASTSIELTATTVE